jgi:sec-independent protein translocase protein TatB
MDGFFGIGLMEIFLIAIIALVVLGPERLPSLMRDLAKHMRTLRGMTSELTSQFSEELKMLDELDPRKIINEVTNPDSVKPLAEAGAKPAKPSTPKPATPAKPPPAARPPSASSNAAPSPASAYGDATLQPSGDEAAAVTVAPVAEEGAEEYVILPPKPAEISYQSII